MKVQRLIEKYKRLEGVWNAERAELARQIFLQDLKQLDEPQKVKVPQFVADWYEKKKHDLNHYIWDYIYNWNHQEESEFKRWMNCSITSFQTLINMHQFGYEVEKEKKYKVVLLNYNDGHLNLVNVRTLGNNIIFFTKRTQFEPRSFELTKNEIISSGFGWVFDCPGIEIEEVE
ncbi:MAG: DUF1642 domain-containing protein [Streptococcus mitis]|nr:DUF1642 domain-containing protein [Streptococcus mitis]